MSIDSPFYHWANRAYNADRLAAHCRRMAHMFGDKPIIGIAGGIGSGKSFVAKLFGQQGCKVINSDELVHQAYRDPKVKQTLRHWWGPMVIASDGELDRATVARKVFDHPDERRRLEGLVHPIVNDVRDQLMKSAANDPAIKAYVWDTPLLFETGLNAHCDAIVFVEAPLEVRLSRLAKRGWDAAELEKRENLQLPLDKKRETSHYVVANTADGSESEQNAEVARGQVREAVKDILSRILAGSTRTHA
jgi:dephospho-CoA kinase